MTIPVSGAAPPNNLTEKDEATADAPSSLTEKAAATSNAPNTLTETSEAVAAIPSDLNEKSGSDATIPNDLFEAAINNAISPNNLLEISNNDAAAPNDLTEQDICISEAPNDLTETPASTPVTPNDLTETDINNPSLPNDLAEIAKLIANMPNDLTEKAIVNPDAPNALIETTEATSETPNDLTVTSSLVATIPAEVVDVPSVIADIPVELTSQAVTVPAVPVDLTEITESDAAAPNTITGVVPTPAIRLLTPLSYMNFSEQIYMQNNVPVSFDDLFTYSRDSSSSFWNRRLNQSGEWESFLDTDYVGDVENLAHYSEDFTNWTAQGLTVISNATTNPVDGLMTADHLVESAGMTHQVDSNTIDFEWYKMYTASFYVKQTANNRNVYLSAPRDVSWGNQAVAVFDTSTGEVLSINSYAYAAASTYEGDGWFRVSLIIEPYEAIPTATAKLYLSDGEDILYTSDGVSGVYAFGGQLTQSEKPLTYVATPAAAAVTESFTELPLYEYDPVTLEPMGVAIWEASTNRLKYSESFKYDSEDELLFWDNHCYAVPHAAIAPDGTMSMRKLSSYNLAGKNVDPYMSYYLYLTTGDQYTFSIFVKVDDVAYAQMSMQDGQRVNFGLTNIEVGEQDAGIDNATIKDCGNGIRRLSCTVTITNTELFCSVGLTDSLTGAYKPGVTWDDELGFFIWGGMLNEGAVALPYVRNYDTVTTRAADDLRMYTENNISLTDMTIVAEFKIDAGGLSRRIFHLPVKSDYSTWTDIFMHLSPTSTLKFRRGGDVFSSTITDYDPYLGTFNTSVMTYSDNYTNGYFNGESVLIEADNVSEFVGVNEKLYIGSYAAIGAWLNGNMNKLEFYDVGMTAAEVSIL